MPAQDDLPFSDSHLVQIIDLAFAATALKSGPWLVCRPGCSQCCVGIFAINQLDAQRLRQGLATLDIEDPERAAELRRRIHQSVQHLSPDYPGDPISGLLHEGVEDTEDFADYANDEVCPVLDPQTGTCDLYAARPMTCRVFGPPVRSEGGLGVCELCYHGATPEEIAACEMVPDPSDVEARLLSKFESETGIHGKTTVAFCLRP